MWNDLLDEAEDRLAHEWSYHYGTSTKRQLLPQCIYCHVYRTWTNWTEILCPARIAAARKR